MTATPELDATNTGSNKSATISNPATGAVAGTVRWTDPADVPRIAAGLRHAQREWEARGAAGRAKVLARFAVWMGEHRDEIEALLIKETGKSATDAAQEVPLLIMIASYYIKTMEKALAPESRPASLPFLSIKKVTVHYRPRPVVGHRRAVELPRRQPADGRHRRTGRGLRRAAQAVRAHPADRRTAAARLDRLRRPRGDGDRPGCPRGRRGRRRSTPTTSSSPARRATGAKVAERAARRLTPISLELGGKDPMIVLEDADVDLAAHAAVWGAFFNAGQTCVSVERVYVLEPIYDEFVAAVVRDVENLKMGAGDGNDFGALIDDSQVAVAERHVADALAKGARALTGGKRPTGPGSFYEPTVLVDVDHSMDCMMEETFGPTLPIMKVQTVAEAVRLANDSPYGLSASVFSKDVERANDVAVELDCGAVNINDVISNLMCTTAPMGGWKTSGIGARFGGADGVRKFCRQEAVIAPRTSVGAGGNYYNNSQKAMKRMNAMITKLALIRPRRAAK